MRRTIALNESFNHMAFACREIFTQEADIMDWWTQVLSDREVKEANNVYQDIEIADEKLELDNKRASTTEYPTERFATRWEVQDRIMAEMEMSPSHGNVFVLAGLVEDSLIEAVQLGDDATKEGLKTPLFKLVGKVTVDIIQEGKV